MMLQCMKNLRCQQSMVIRGNDSQISLLHPRSSHFHHCWHHGTQDGPSKCLVLSLSESCLSLKIHPLFIPSPSHALWFTNVTERSRGFGAKPNLTCWLQKSQSKVITGCLALALPYISSFFCSRHLRLEVLHRGGFLCFIPHGLVVLSLDLSSSSSVTLSLVSRDGHSKLLTGLGVECQKPKGSCRVIGGTSLNLAQLFWCVLHPSVL